MYYEEKIIDGVMHWRNDPNKKFVPYSIQELLARYVSVSDRLNKLFAGSQGGRKERGMTCLPY